MSHCGTSSLIIILITASLSSNTTKLLYEKNARLREHGQHYSQHWTFLETALARDSYHGKQRVSPFYHGSESCFQGLKQSDSITQERESRLISILRPKRWFRILMNCVKTEVCFLHNQLIGTNVWLPKTHSVLPEVDFEPSRSPAKSESWNSPSLHCFAVLPTWQCC